MPKFHGEKAGAKSTPSKVIKYILDKDKMLAYDTIGLADDRPYSKQFREIARLQGSKYSYDERKYYHYKLTFEEKDWDKNEGQITPEKALEIAKRFCNEKFKGYDAVLSVHGDTKNLHVHIVLNAFSNEYKQNKIHVNDKRYAELKDWAYEIGKEYGIEEKFWRDEVKAKRVRQAKERREMPEPEPINFTEAEERMLEEYGNRFSEKSFKEKYRIAIAEARNETTNLENFIVYLKENFNIDTKISAQGNIKYKFADRKSYSSGKALGSEYMLESIEKSLAETKQRPSDLPTEETIQVAEWLQKFEEEYNKFYQWEAEFRQTELHNTEMSEYEKHILVFQKAEALYSICQDVKDNEILAASLKEEDYIKLEEQEEARRKMEQFLREYVQEQIELANYQARQQEYKTLERHYDAMKDELRKIRAAAKQEFRADLAEKYNECYKTEKSYYSAMSSLARSETLFGMLISASRAVYVMKKGRKISEQINELKSEKRSFYENTRNLEAFKKAYEEGIKAGKMPGEEYMKSLAETIREMEPTPTRDTYINTLRTTGVSVAEKIAAANGLYELNVKEGRTKDYQTQAQELYGKDPRTIKESKTNHYNPNWKIQSLMDSVRIARELGAENALELEAKVKSVGRAYGKIKREYTAAKKQYNETINKASAEFSAENSELSMAERLQRLEAIIETESQKLQPLEKRFNEAKNYYKKCARALEATQEFNVSKDLYTTPGGWYKYKSEEQKQETPDRSKAEAEKEREKQWNDLRNWADEAKETVAKKTDSDPENDLKEWVAEMKKHGCQVRITANTISLKHPDSNQAVRTNRLDNKYAKENLINDISIQRKNREKERANETATELGGNRSNENRNNGDEKINDKHNSEHVKEFRNTSEFER